MALALALAALATCQLGLEFVDTWCASLEPCALPCLQDADLQCRFAGEVQAWMDPCFYLPDASCVFPCKLEEETLPSLPIPPAVTPPPPPPPGHAACVVAEVAPYLVEHWWERQCATAASPGACATAGKYCTWRVGV